MSRERLQLVTEHSARMANDRPVHVAGQLLVAAGSVFVALRVRSIWHDSHLSLGSVSWAPLLAAAALGAGLTAAAGLIWLAILRRLGVSSRAWWVGIFFQAQLTRYFRGASGWQYAGRTGMARTHRIPVGAVVLSFPIELAASLISAAACATLVAGW